MDPDFRRRGANSLKINDLEKKYMYTEKARFGRKLVWLIKLCQYFSQA